MAAPWRRAQRRCCAAPASAGKNLETSVYQNAFLSTTKRS